MAERLADETLTQILDQVLAVDDADFSSCADRSPFGNRHWSSANALFVCKRWMRVGTPALYHTTVLRSNAQAQSLMRALKKNQFGAYIRKLRLEGWFGTALRMIFESSTNMTDICFQISATSKNNVDSFCSLIGIVSARRVIIWNTEESYTKQATRVRHSVDDWLRSISDPIQLVAREAIMADISFCSTAAAVKVTHIDLYIPNFNYMYRLTDIFGVLVKILPQANFRQLSLDYAGNPPINIQDTEQKFLNRIQDIITGTGISLYESKIRIRFRSCPLIASWGSLSEQQARLIESSSDATLWGQEEMGSIPMHDRPQALQVTIWAMIIRRAVENVRLGRSRQLVAYIKVCRVLRVAVSLVMPEDLHLWSEASVQNALHSELPIERVLLVNNCHFSSRHTYAYPPHWFNFDDVFFSRCGTLSSLQTLRLHHFACRNLPKLAAAVGSFIRRLEIGFHNSTVVNDRQIIRFVELQRLTLIGWAAPQLSWDLPQLEILEAWNINDMFLFNVAQSALPRLCHFGFENTQQGMTPDSLLSSHGAKLRTLVVHFDFANMALKKCPNLITLTFLPLSEARTISKVTPPTPHLALREIKLPIRSFGVPHRPRDSMKARRRLWHDLIDSFDKDKTSFPVLERVIMGDYTWPVDASHIKNSVEVIIAEEIMERGLDVVDRYGHKWRPRLRAGGSTGVRKRKAVRPAAL